MEARVSEFSNSESAGRLSVAERDRRYRTIGEQLKERGLDAVITKSSRGALHQIPYDLIARPTIKRGQDLKGKPCRGSLTGGSTRMFKEVAQKAFGLTDKDTSFSSWLTSPDRFAALKGG
jgi:hypothetical protein